MTMQCLLDKIEVLEARMQLLEKQLNIDPKKSVEGLTGKQIQDKYKISRRTRYRWIEEEKLKKIGKNGRVTLYQDPYLPVKKV